MTQVAIRRGREHFPRTVEAVDELPAAVRDELIRLGAADDASRIVVIPPQRYPIPRQSWRRILPYAWRWTPHRTLVFGDECLLVVEGTNTETLQTVTIPLAAIVSIQIDLILLYSYLELTWVSENRIERFRCEFNSVGLRLLEGGLQRVHGVLAGRAQGRFRPAPPPTSTRHFPLKFHNYVQMSLLPGEDVRAAVYQPALRVPGKRLRALAGPNRAIVLTDRNLLLVEDAWRHGGDLASSKYRINRVFYPRDSILAARRDRDAGLDTLCLTVGTVAARHELRLPLAAENLAALLPAFETWFLV